VHQPSAVGRRSAQRHGGRAPLWRHKATVAGFSSARTAISLLGFAQLRWAVTACVALLAQSQQGGDCRSLNPNPKTVNPKPRQGGVASTQDMHGSPLYPLTAGNSQLSYQWSVSGAAGLHRVGVPAGQVEEVFSGDYAVLGSQMLRIV